MDTTQSHEKSRRSRRFWIRLLIGVEFLELILANLAERGSLPFSQISVSIAEPISQFVSVLHNYDHVATYPHALSAFFTLSLPLIFLKYLFHCWWLTKDGGVNAKYLVVTPLTNKTPRSFQDFAGAPFMNGENEGAPRSKASAIFVSVAILIWTLVSVAMVLNTGYIEKNLGGKDITLSFRGAELAGNGYILWIVWSVCLTNYIALLLAISSLIMRDYFRLFTGGYCK